MNLQICGVSKTYSGGVRALKDVSLTAPTGMFGLLGPNGSGKTTLMRTIATLQDPDEGTVHLGPTNVLEDKAAVRQKLGYLPQDFGVYPGVSAYAMLSHLATLKGITRARQRRTVVDSLLQCTNLWEVRKKKLGAYSGGMKQRFGVAQALLGKPELIMVDEPTAGLDPEERVRFLNLLSEVSENAIVILSTHIVEDVSEICTKMAIIKEGQVLHTGSPQAAIDRIHGKTWKKIIDKSALDEHKRNFRVISTRLVCGQVEIHVFSHDLPDPTFASAAPDLRDVYFTTLHGFGNGKKTENVR